MQFTFVREVIKKFHHIDYGILYNCYMYTVSDESGKVGKLFSSNEVAFFAFGE